MTKGDTVGPGEVGGLFKNLSAWKEESQNQILNAINSYDKSMRDTIFHLVQEVYGLKTQLSITTREKSALIDTVNKLNVEIMELKATVSIADPLMEPMDNMKGSTQETTKCTKEVQNHNENVFMSNHSRMFTRSDVL